MNVIIDDKRNQSTSKYPSMQEILNDEMTQEQREEFERDSATLSNRDLIRDALVLLEQVRVANSQ